MTTTDRHQFRPDRPPPPRHAAPEFVWPLLADDLFRVAHDDRDGGRLLHPDVAAIALSAALLGELLLAGRITVHAGDVVVVDPRPPVDALAHTVLDHLVAEPDVLPVRDWLLFLAQTSYAEVAQRLVRTGHVQAVTERRLFTRSTRYLPVSMNAAAWPWARLSTLLSTGRGLDLFDTVLGGLILASDLHRRVLTGASGEVTARLQAAVAETPAPVRELVHETQTAAGATVKTF